MPVPLIPLAGVAPTVVTSESVSAPTRRWLTPTLPVGLAAAAADRAEIDRGAGATFATAAA